MNRLLVPTAAVLLLAACAHPSPPVAGTPPPAVGAQPGAVPVVEFLRAQGVVVQQDFAGPSGLRGWVITRAGRSGVVYSTADGQTLISGLLTDARGGNLAARDEELHIPGPDYGTLWTDLATSAYVEVGNNPAAPVVYVFADLNCPYCHQTWTWLADYRERLTVRWVPVAILGADSAPKAAAVLADADPAARFDALMQDFHAPLGTPPDATTQQAQDARLAANLKLMERAGASGTPALVLRNASGVRVREGLNAPGDLGLIVPTLTAR